MKKTKVADAGINPTVTYDAAEAIIRLTWQDGGLVGLSDIDPATLFVLHTQSIGIGGGESGYPEIHHWAGKTYMGWRDGAPPNIGHLKDIEYYDVDNLGQIHGARPSVFGGKWFAYIAGGALSGYPVHVRDLDTFETRKNVRLAAGTGLSRVDDTESGPVVHTIDEDRNIVPGISDPAWAGQCVVGVTDRDGQPVCLARIANGNECIVSKGEDSQNPRICTDGRSFYVTAWSAKGEGIRLWRLDLSDFEPPAAAPTPFGVGTNDPKALGYFFSTGKYGTFDTLETCAVVPKDAWQDSNGSHPADIADQLCDAIAAAGTGVVSNTAIDLATPVWDKVIGVFAGEQQGVVWAHEPVTRAEAEPWVKATRDRMDKLGLPRRPVITLLREDRATDKQFIGVSEVLAPELYFSEPQGSYDQMLSVARARIAEICTALSPSPLYICVQAFDRAKDAWRRAPWALEAIQQAANEAIGRSQILGLFWFAYARPGGVLTYPQLEAWHNAQIALTPRPLLPVDPIEPVDPIDPIDPVGDEMTAEDVRRYVANLPDKVLFGALERFHNEVLPRDRPKDGVIKAGDNTDMWTGDVVTGGANGYFVRSYVSEFIIACDKGRTVDQASGDGYDAAIASYLRAVNPQ